jgi:hypothetical protein
MIQIKNQPAQITKAVSFQPLTADDIADIGSLFHHTPRSFGDDARDLRLAANRRPQHTNDKPLTFGLRSMFPGNI